MKALRARYVFQVVGDEQGTIVDKRVRNSYNIRRKDDNGDEPVYLISGCKVRVFKNLERGELEIISKEPNFIKRANAVSKLIFEINQKTKLRLALKP